MAAQNKSIVYCSKSENYLADRLFDLIHNGEDVTTVQNLLKEGVDIEARDSNSYTPLLLACLHQRKKIVDLLIASGANVDVKCKDNEWTVLHHASRYGWIDLVQSLVKKVSDLDSRDIRSETALHHSVKSRCLEVMKCLVKQGADIDIKSNKGASPLIYAVHTQWIDAIDLLLNAGANVDGYEELLLYCASEFNRTDLVHSFVKKVPDLNKYVYGETALHIASKLGHLEIVKCLVEKGTNMNIKNISGETALYNAAHKGHLEIVKWLVEKGADINIKDCDGVTPILEAARKSRKDVVDFLMHHGADINATNQINCTLLHYATQNEWIDVVQFTVKRNCDVHARDKYGITALTDACIFERWNILQYLLQEGARCDFSDEKGNSPLNYITGQEPINFEAIKLLVENGAYFKSVDYEALVKSSSLEALQDAALCSQAIINKFNNHDLLEFYNLPASGSLPRIEKMKIASRGEVAQAIKRTVEFEIQTKGHCNILEIRPMALSIFSLRSVLEYREKKNLELRNCLKRPATYDRSTKCQPSSKVIRVS